MNSTITVPTQTTEVSLILLECRKLWSWNPIWIGILSRVPTSRPASHLPGVNMNTEACQNVDVMSLTLRDWQNRSPRNSVYVMLPKAIRTLTLTVCVRFGGSTAVAMKNAVFSHMTPRGSCKNRRFGGTYRFHHQAGKNQQARNNVSSN
jgi:hypothetical protein